MDQPTKDPSGLITVTFDFSDQTSATPVSATCTGTPYQGTDSTPLVFGSATISGTQVSFPVTGGTNGMIYDLRCAGVFADGTRYAGTVLTVTKTPPGTP